MVFYYLFVFVSSEVIATYATAFQQQSLNNLGSWSAIRS